MTLRDKLPVESLSRAAWQRVREETFAELDSGSSPAVERAPRARLAPVVFALASAVAAAALTVLFLRGGAEQTDVSSSSRIVATHDLARTTLGDVVLEATPGSALVTTGSDTIGWTVLLERGEVSFAVPKRERRPSFKVQAADALVEVIGTRFTVAREGERVTVAVSEGTVRVTSNGRALDVHAGKHWESEPAPLVPEVAVHPEAPAAPSVPENAPAPAPSSARQATAPRSLTLPQPESAPPAPELAAPLPVASEAQAPEAVPPAPAVPSAAPAPKSTERDRFETASRLERTQPSAALALYSELSRGSGPWAANALYAAGRLELERGQKARAKRLLELYAERFPNGSNIEEARRLLETLR